MKKTNLLILLISGILLSFMPTDPDLSGMEERTVAIQLDNAATLTFPKKENCSFMAGNNLAGIYSSSLKVKGTETELKIKKGTPMVFFARGMSGMNSLPISVVKLEKTEKNREAHSTEGLTENKRVDLTAIPITVKQTDKKLQLYRFTLNKEADTGIYCVNFHNTNGRAFMISDQPVGKMVYCFEITE